MSITGASATYLLSIPLLFPAPIQLQGFAADDVFDTDSLESTEVLMGVDGFMSAGFVFVPVKQSIHLQADSPSNAVFDQWWTAQQAIQDTYSAVATIILPTLGIKWAMTNGYLTTYQPLSSIKKLIQPRTHAITWNNGTPASV
jgi:hypothetical protein